MSNGTITTFRNVRTRLTRSPSGPWLSGWMKNLTDKSARLRLNSLDVLHVGERLCGECYGNGALVCYEGIVLGQIGLEVALALDCALNYVPCTETVRIEVQGFEALVFDERQELGLIVMDASPRSLGGTADGVLAVGSLATMVATTQEGEIEAGVGVVNCRAVVGEAGRFRVGLKILGMRRLDAARWMRLVDEWSRA